MVLRAHNKQASEVDIITPLSWTRTLQPASGRQGRNSVLLNSITQNSKKFSQLHCGPQFGATRLSVVTLLLAELCAHLACAQRGWQISVLWWWCAAPKHDSDCMHNPVVHLELEENLYSHLGLLSEQMSAYQWVLEQMAISRRSAQDQTIAASLGSPPGYFRLPRCLFRFPPACHPGSQARTHARTRACPQGPPCPPADSRCYVGRGFWHSFFLECVFHFTIITIQIKEYHNSQWFLSLLDMLLKTLWIIWFKPQNNSIKCIQVVFLFYL